METATNELLETAQKNLADLEQNPYPGRFIGIGLDETGTKLIQIYAIMGRSPLSRNRCFEMSGRHTVNTKVLDESLVPAEQLALIKYVAMTEKGRHYAVSNGAQTADALHRSFDSYYGLANIAYRGEWGYELDAPNRTARITAINVLLDNMKFSTEILLLRKSVFGDTCMKSLYKYDEFAPGFGVYVSTYNGDGNPLPTFTGEPRIIPFIGDQDTLTKEYWNVLNSENKVSICSKYIDIRTAESIIHIINKH